MKDESSKNCRVGKVVYVEKRERGREHVMNCPGLYGKAELKILAIEKRSSGIRRHKPFKAEVLTKKVLTCLTTA